jgi:hypothetical protein
MIYSRWIGEEHDVRARENFDVVERVELSAQEIVQKDSGIVGRARINPHNRWRKQSPTRSDEQQVSFVWTCSPVYHLDSVRKVKLRFQTVEIKNLCPTQQTFQPTV